MGRQQKKKIPRFHKELTIRGKDSNTDAVYIVGPPGSDKANRITLYPGDAETIVIRQCQVTALWGNEHQEMQQVLAKIGMLNDVKWLQVEFEFPDSIEEQEELDTEPYKLRLIGIDITDSITLPKELSPCHYSRLCYGPTPFDYAFRILVWRLQAFCPGSTVFIEEVWNPGQGHLLTPRGLEGVAPRDWERAVRNAVKHLKQLLYFNIEKSKQFPKAGRRPGSGNFSSPDELKAALVKAIKHQYQYGKLYSEEAIAQYFSSSPNFPSCSDRQIRRWIKVHLGMTWDELVEEALSS